jgi:mRNA-degrading endonuclease toxin of MazEF toxin-antitoxin module
LRTGHDVSTFDAEAGTMVAAKCLHRSHAEGALMNYNFTDRVRRILAMAREEAIRLQHDYVGTEHLLLGLIREGEGGAAAVLMNLNVDLEQIHERIEDSVRKGRATIALGELPYMTRAKKVVDYAMDEARELNLSYIGTEHLPLGLLREENGIAAQVLNALGVTLEAARAETLELLGSDVNPAQTGASSSRSGRSRRADLRRGELYHVRRPGADTKRFGTCVVVSRQALIDSPFPSVVCAPVVTHGERLATQVEIGVAEGLAHTGWIDCDQLVSVPRARLSERVGSLSDDKLIELNTALRVALDLV